MAETNNVGWRYVEYMKVGDEYQVRTLGDTIGAVWNASGAIIGGQSLPDIGRRFVCLSPGNGTGSVEDLQLNLNATLGPISGTVAISNFPATQPVSGTVSVDNFTPDATTNTFLVAYVTTGNWYKVESVGTTSGAQWNGVGAIIGGESTPPVGRVFKALSNAPGTGTVSTIIYSQNVEVSNALTTSLFVKNDATTKLLVQSPTISCVSLDVIGLTSQVISSSQNTIRSISLSNVGAVLGVNFCYLKIYASATATNANTPIANIGVKSGDTVVIPCDLFVGTNICCRATDDFNPSSTTAPAGTITASFFIYTA